MPKKNSRTAPFPSGKTPGEKAQGQLAGLFPEEEIRRIKGWDLADAKAAHKDYVNRAKDYASEPEVAKNWQRKADLIAKARPAVTRVTAAEARINRQVERMVNRGVMSSEKKFDAISDQERNYQRATGKRMPVNFKAAAEFGASGIVHGDMDKNQEINAGRKELRKKLEAVRWSSSDPNRQSEDPDGPQYSNAKYEHRGVGGETQFTNRGGSGSPGGGKGRGNWGHKGRPGKRGGSA